MITKALGRTGMIVTQLGFGAMELRGPKVWDGREISDEASDRILNAVLDAGINFIDTAVDYGLSEERIGRFISGRRAEYFLATKCGCDPREVGDRWETPHSWTRDTILRNIEGSLRRLQTDHVDILQLHNPTVDQVRRGGLIETLEDIRDQGLARFIGVSTALPDLDGFLEMGAFDTFQVPYSCIESGHHDAITKLGEAGVGVIVRGGIAQGLTLGEVAGDAGLRRRSTRLLKYTSGMGSSEISELTLRFTLSHPHCHTTIVGTLSVEHLALNVDAARLGSLPPELHSGIRSHLEGPWWRKLVRHVRSRALPT